MSYAQRRGITGTGQLASAPSTARRHGEGREPGALLGRLIAPLATLTVLPLVVLGATAGTAAAAGAAGAGEFSFYSGPAAAATFGADNITAGSDGALWYTDSNADGSTAAVIERISTTGSIQTYEIGGPEGAVHGAYGIASGSDGALWFTSYYGDSVGRITTTGVVTQYSVPAYGYPGMGSIIAGTDGALWFSYINSNFIGRLTTAGVFSSYSCSALPGQNVSGLAGGPDGSVWCSVGHRIGLINSAGSTTYYDGTGIAGPMTVGPTGALWFVSHSGHAISRMTTAGVITNTYTSPAIVQPHAIAFGPDGHLWFTNYGDQSTSVGRMSTTGVFTQFDNGAINDPIAITAGPDGAMWFTNADGSVGRITTAVTPQITGLTPPWGGPGASVGITGLNLNGVTSVTFNGTTATILSHQDRRVTVTVPLGATPGPVTLTTPAGTATSAQDFTGA
jgi:virginiamycin B lyase